MIFAVLTNNVWISFITPTLDEHQPDIAIDHIRCNDITRNNIDNIDVKNITPVI